MTVPSYDPEMAGPVALHGGGEFLPGDEPFLRALLDAAAVQADERGGPDEPIRVAVMPTAAAGQNPDVAARFGSDAFERLADGAGLRVNVETARVIDASSADDPATAATIEAADLIYLPGGDPYLIPTLLPGTAAWRAMDAAYRRGTVLAGASAGAMGLCQFTWTPRGVIPGLDVVHGLVVVPHADAAMWDRQSGRFAMASAAGVGVLGIGERTGVISPGAAIGATNDGTVPWLVVGEGEVRWLPNGAAEPRIAVDGETLELPI
jgi:cyanophycinase